MLILDVPTGDTPTEVNEYYDYLLHIWLERAGGQTFMINWNNIFWVGLWIFILTATFGVYTFWQRYTRAHREPYPLESYDGHIQEMNGPVGGFLFLIFATVFAWAAILTILRILNGQIY